MFEKFTDKARRSVVLAQEEARSLQHSYIGTEHLLLGLLAESQSLAARALQDLGIGLEDVRSDVLGLVGRGTAQPADHIPFTPRAKTALELSLREALRLNHNYIGTEHILLGLLGESEGVAATVLGQRGASPDAVRAKVLELLGVVMAERLQQVRVSAVESVLAQPFPTSPAAERALDALRNLAKGRPVTSLDVLVALLGERDSAAARSLVELFPEHDVEALVQRLRDTSVAGTADELPQEAGLRGMRLNLTDDALTVEVTDPHLLQQAKDTFAELGASSLAGDDARASSLSDVWLALAASLAGIRSQLGGSPEPA